MQVSSRGLAIIENFEAFGKHNDGKPYLDQVGVPTIGFGTTFYPGGKKVTMDDPEITRAQAVSYLENYCNLTIIPTLQNHVTVSLNQNQIDALASFIYNLGSGALIGSHLLIQVNAKASCSAITAEFNKWVYADHKVLQDLVERRAEEAKLFCS